jgi:cytoskeletal protein CcmA (bactofilin family)
MMVVLLGIAAISITYGEVSYMRGRLQNAVDAAALAGAQLAATGSNPTTDQAWLKQQNLGPNGTMTVTASRTVPNGIRATGVVQIPAGFAGIFGIHQFTVSATAVATYGNPAFDDVIFQGDPQSGDPPLSISGSDVVQSGNVHSNDGLVLDGSQAIDGACSAAGTVTVNGAGGCTAGIQQGVPQQPMPAWTVTQLTAQATHIVGSASNPVGYTFSGTTEYSGNWVVFGNVTITGAFNGPGSIIAIGGSITIRGSAVVGATGGTGVCLAALPPSPDSQTPENITLRGAHVITGTLYAPTGTVSLGGSDVISGSVVGYHVTLGGSDVVNYDANVHQSIPFLPMVQLVR